jgi:hemolysin activation/secretion protein
MNEQMLMRKFSLAGCRRRQTLIEKYLLVISFLFVSVSAVAEDGQGSNFLKRPGADLPALPEFIHQQDSESILLPELPQELIPDYQNKQRFMLEGIVLDGNHVVSDAELTAAVDSFIGTEISLADLETIRLALTQVYKDKGYTSSGVILKDQHISDRTIKFEVIEGRLETINISNAGRLHDSYIANRLLVNNQGPLQISELQKNFQLLLADPLIDRLNGVLKPGATPGATILDLEVTRNPQPYGLYLNFDNHTPPSLGAYTGRLGGYIRNLTGFGDVAGLEMGISEGLKSLDFNYAIPINRYNTKFLFDFQTSNADIIESPLNRLDIESDFYHFEFGLSHPVYNSLNRKFLMDVRFAYRENSTSLLGQPFAFSGGVDQGGDSVVSVVRLAQNFIDRGRNHALSLRSIFSIGIDAFGSTVSKDLADSEFFSWIGQANYAHRLNDHGVQMVLRGSVQLSNDTLLPLERFALGGHATVRGYRENYRVRDEGYFVSAELHYPLIQPADFSGHSLVVVPFADVGAAWNHEDSINETLYSAGVGLKWGWKILSAELFWAHTFKSPDSQNEYDLQDDGVHVQLSTRIF